MAQRIIECNSKRIIKEMIGFESCIRMNEIEG